MNYTELCTNIENICENEFSAQELAMFTEQSEQKIYNTVQIPAIRRNVTGTLTTGNKYLQIPSDFLYVYSLAVIESNGEYHYLIDKDVNFIREAYPRDVTATRTTPKYYAIFDNSAFILGPTPDQSYSAELHYGYYPESIVTAGTSWLGDNFDTVLLYGSLVEAYTYMKGEADMMALYNGKYQEALGLLKNLGDAKQRGDAYQDGQVRLPVR